MGKIEIKRKDYIWNYLGYGFNLGLNIILLPLVLYYLPSQELGLWYVFLSIGSFVTLFDFGFAPQMARQVSYVFAGAGEITSEGISRTKDEEINVHLFGLIVKTSKFIYLIIAIVVIFLMLTIGSLYIRHISTTIFNNSTILAWVFYSVSCFINIYFSFYNTIFRGTANFVALNKAVVFSKSTQLIVCFVGLYLGYGLLAVSFAYFICGIIFRLSLLNSYRSINISSNEKYSLLEVTEIFKKIWHNAWRDGICMVARFLSTQSNTILCSLYLSLTMTANYSLSLQIITITSTIAMMFFTTIQPQLNEETLNKNLKNQRSLFSVSIISYFFVYWIIIIAFVLLGNEVLNLLQSKTAIYIPLFVVISIYLFFEGLQSLCASFISSSNKLFYYKAFFISSLVGIIGSVVLLKYTNLGVWALVVSPMFVQACYNNWKWPVYVLNYLGLKPMSFLKIGFSSIYQKITNHKK